MEKDSIRIVQQETDFVRGVLPVKYLGVPLDSKKLNVLEYKPLIDKMLSRINHWSTRLLSYAGRFLLVKSVLFSIANYWMQIFALPKKIIHHIEALCRRFLWTRSDIKTKKAHVAWDQVCNPKKVGGLNMISLVEWNQATIGKMIWNLNEKKGQVVD
ncbi:unnamed protein product [Vicia faba]|uniref:Reverse transcriptase n=1 Tax=Vicia faba TaxID=3906 RepID=A0AAV0ZTG2_VICFA|nr:unnamed protein product [Vicia faba]